ncbi:MAG: VOC family protein [Anaerolineales bacterium]|nr:VOC family protein [Anaerolineales bacterium]
MSEFRLHPETQIGRVFLQVSDISRALVFYQDYLGLHLVGQNGEQAALSASGNGPALIVLKGNLAAHPKPSNTSGLYHVAIRLPDRTALSRVFRRLLDVYWPFQGFADHGVSEALYLADPDENGLELYADHPCEKWTGPDGKIKMGTFSLDVEDLLSSGSGPWTGIDPGADIGHVHLQVADMDRSEAFYAGLLGLEVMERGYPGALFLSAGGYHHHLGLNTWAGIGAPPPPVDAVGLRSFSLAIPEKELIHTLSARIQAAGFKMEQLHQDSFLVRDPDGNGVEILPKG